MSQHETHGRVGRDKIWMTVVVILLLLLVAVVALRLRVGHRFRNRMDELRAQGYPMSEADLNEHYAIPSGAENAADLYMQAFAAYVEANDVEKQGLPKVGTAKLPGLGEPLPNDMKILARAFLAKNEAALSCLHRAAKLKHCQFPVKFSQDPQQWVSDPTTVRQAAFLLCLEASVHLDNEDPNRAANSVKAALGMAGKFPASILMNRLVQVAMQALALQSLERVLNQVPPTEQDLLSLSETIYAFEASQGLRQTFIGERCYGLYSLDQTLGRTVLARAVGIVQSQSTKHIAITMVNGCYDVICPPINAQRLKQRIPHAKLILAESAGHWMGEKPIEQELLKAVREFE